MKVLHTSDWHIGRALYGQNRYEEHEAFLNWLADAIQEHHIEVLLVSGDVFDSSTPSNRAQALYYRFLGRIASGAGSCRHIVLIAGNHDSPTLLDAPKGLLEQLNVHVVGGPCDPIADEAIVLHDRDDAPELIVCAVPFLRDRDLRAAEAGESIDDKNRKLVAGLRNHYATVTEAALNKKNELDADLPIVAMGHLFTAGGQTNDGVRELYVGSLAQVDASIFPGGLNYVALGHLHTPQKVGGSDWIRYCGSPLALSFGEAGQQKTVCTVDLKAGSTTIHLLDVPTFQQLEQIRGDWASIARHLQELVRSQSHSWLEILYEGEEVIGDLRERIDQIVVGSTIKLLRIQNQRVVDRILAQASDEETLADLSEMDVFRRCLDAQSVPEAQHEELIETYQEVLLSLQQADPQAE
jgi:exonuclease SbcD